MVSFLPPLTIQVTKTSDGDRDYVQIMSADQFSVNIVLISDQITVEDHRESPKSKPESKPESKPKRKQKRGI